MQTTQHISSRSRQIGLGWTNDVERDRASGGGLRVRRVAAPDVEGPRAVVLAALERAIRVNHGNDWHVALYIKGRRVATHEIADYSGVPWVTPSAIRELLYALTPTGYEIDVEEEV